MCRAMKPKLHAFAGMQSCGGAQTQAPSFSSDSYPHFTNGGEKQDDRPQEAFAKRASLSRWFASPEDHHGSVPDSHPGVPLPSKTYPPSWSQASDQSAGPTRPASKDQSPQKQDALVLHERTHVPATSARQEGTTDPANGSGRQPFAIAVLQCDSRF